MIKNLKLAQYNKFRHVNIVAVYSYISKTRQFSKSKYHIYNATVFPNSILILILTLQLFYSRVLKFTRIFYSTFFLSLNRRGMPPCTVCTMSNWGFTGTSLLVPGAGSTSNLERSAAIPASDCIRPRRSPINKNRNIG